MEYAKLNQIQLADATGVKQQNISKILRRKQQKSADLVKLAMACGVRPEWLAMEDGLMVDDGLVVHDERIKHLARACMDLPSYDVDRLVQAGDALKKLSGTNGS